MNRFDKRKPGEKESVRAVCWLVEYLGAVPCPVYAKEDLFPTCDPWEAKKFESQEAALKWMHRDGIVAYNHPWAAIEHVFIVGDSALHEPNRI